MSDDEGAGDVARADADLAEALIGAQLLAAYVDGGFDEVEVDTAGDVFGRPPRGDVSGTKRRRRSAGADDDDGDDGGNDDADAESLSGALSPAVRRGIIDGVALPPPNLQIALPGVSAARVGLLFSGGGGGGALDCFDERFWNTLVEHEHPKAASARRDALQAASEERQRHEAAAAAAAAAERERYSRLLRNAYFLSSWPAAAKQRRFGYRVPRCRRVGTHILYYCTHCPRLRWNHALQACAYLQSQLRLPLVCVAVFADVDAGARTAAEAYHRDCMHAFADALARQKGVSCRCFQTRDAAAFFGAWNAQCRPHIVLTDESYAHDDRLLYERVARALSCPLFSVDSTFLVPLRYEADKYSGASAYKFRAVLRERLMALHASTSPDDRPVDVALQRYRVPDEVDAFSLAGATRVVGGGSGGGGGGADGSAPARGELAAQQCVRAFCEQPLASNSFAELCGRSGVASLLPHVAHGCVSVADVLLTLLARCGAMHAKFRKAFDVLAWRVHSTTLYFFNAPLAYAALPAWVRATLGADVRDERRTLLTQRELAECRSPAALWNCVQACLNRLHVLHPAVHTFWGAMIVEWSSDPEDAFNVIVELLHAKSVTAQMACFVGMVIGDVFSLSPAAAVSSLSSSSPSSSAAAALGAPRAVSISNSSSSSSSSVVSPAAAPSGGLPVRGLLKPVAVPQTFKIAGLDEFRKHFTPFCAAVAPSGVGE